jgi:hypothetical protein
LYGHLYARPAFFMADVSADSVVPGRQLPHCSRRAEYRPNRACASGACKKYLQIVVLATGIHPIMQE